MAADRIGVSVEDLAAALEGFEAGFSLADGTNLAGTVLYPKVIAGRLWQVLGEQSASAAHREPDDGTVTVAVSRDVLLQVIGWVNAHRPPGNWEPQFVSGFLRAAEKAVRRDG